MGRIREFSCQSCGEVWQLQLGHGMNHAALENVLEVFSEDIQKCLESGMNAHTAKPINLDEVLSLLKKYIMQEKD